MTTIDLLNAIKCCEFGSYPCSYSNLDIVEPLAAAVELFQEDTNARQVCAVIDIGAGTTDLGLFLSLTPDPNLDLEVKPYKRKFKSLTQSISLNFAGDYIDNAILQIFKEKARLLSNDQIKAFEIMIRDRKLEIFSRLGKTTYMGIDVSYNELATSKYISKLKTEISNSFTSLLMQSEEVLNKLIDLRTHYIREINLVFAGGGHDIKFIREAIPKKYESKVTLPITVSEAKDQLNLRLSIDSARLAVSRGGTTASDDWPNTNPDARVIGPNDSGPWF
jgi:molecular chaperone DnaK (HSP70)